MTDITDLIARVRELQAKANPPQTPGYVRVGEANLTEWAAVIDEIPALKAKLAEAERENLTLRNRIGIDRTSWHEAEAEVKVLRAKLAKTERERDDAMTLAEERRDYARAQNAKLSVECDDLRAQLTAVERERDEARAERDTLGRRVEDAQAALNECGAGFTGQPEATRIRDLRARLAESTEWGSRACEVLGYVLGTLNLCDEQHWAFDPLNVEPVKDKAVAVRLLVRDLRAQLAKTERVVEAASGAWKAALAGGPIGPQWAALGQALDALAALRALDDSGGSGAAIAAGHTSGTPDASSARVAGASPRGQDSTPEPAGSSRCVACLRYPGPGNAAACADVKGFPFAPGEDCACRCHDPQAPATLAEVDELRWRVERLENLTGSGSGSGSGSG